MATINLKRIGHFLEAFDGDAAIVAKVLGIVATLDRSGRPICGIPFHREDAWTTELRAAGYDVVVS